MSAGGSSGPGPRAAVVGGGLAGLAATTALAERGFRVTLLEARRRLGGRATSFQDPQTGELVDHCQHVSMRCCTNLADFARRTDIAPLFRRDRVLHFFGPDGRSYRLGASRCLPAPVHLAPALWGLKYLTPRERLAIARAMWKLARMRPEVADDDETIGGWLQRHGQSPRACELFWGVVLVSALGEELDRASLKYARQVFVEGFMATREGYDVEVPRVPLGTLYGEQLESWLAAHGVELRLAAPVTEIAGSGSTVSHVTTRDGQSIPCDFAVCAVTWRRWPMLLNPELRAALDHRSGVSSSKAGGETDLASPCLDSSPITGVHLWFDRPITPLPHATLVGRLSQWVFNRSGDAGDASDEHYYQVVISASRSLAGRAKEHVVGEILDDLRAVFPETAAARLLRSRVVIEHDAVFSVTPGVDRLRPSQRTPIKNLMLAGDWTATGWPSTMEGAVRSGYLAAEAVLEACGQPEKIVSDNLPRGLLSRWLLRDV